MQRLLLFLLPLLALAGSVQAQINTITVSQTGTAQSVSAVQTGSGNQATINQLTGTALVPNTSNVASVTQTAVSSNGTDVNQAFINQLNGSDYNQAVIKQTVGSGNTATIKQKGNDTYRTGGTQLRGSNPLSPSAATAGNYATIAQQGSANTGVIIRQNAGTQGTSQANYAAIGQVGDQNLGAAIDQNNQSLGNTATIDQGTSNGSATLSQASIVQIDNSQLNQAYLLQQGSGNIGELNQSSESSNNLADARQLGTDGNATLIQSQLSSFNQATLVQQSSSQGATGTIYQTNNSAYNRASITQAGKGDGAQIQQNDQSKNNDALIQQGIGGTNNDAVIIQTYAYAGTGNSPVLGSGNSATISQNQTSNSSTGNQVVVQQGFSDGVSLITGQQMISVGNQASVSQEYDLNVTYLLQGGEQNRATVRQNGNSTLKGVDTGMDANPTAGQYGNQNILTVQQSGTVTMPNIGNVTQIGNGNAATITQTVPTKLAP